jgi:hypothetical protein
LLIIKIFVHNRTLSSHLLFNPVIMLRLLNALPRVRLLHHNPNQMAPNKLALPRFSEADGDRTSYTHQHSLMGEGRKLSPLLGRQLTAKVKLTREDVEVGGEEKAFEGMDKRFDAFVKKYEWAFPMGGENKEEELTGEIPPRFHVEGRAWAYHFVSEDLPWVGRYDEDHWVGEAHWQGVDHWLGWKTRWIGKADRWS